MLPDRRHAIQDALFILLAAWASLDHLGWVRFIAALPIPGWLKMFLWGWV